MGKIILLNTPIGNLEDLTPRVLNSLKEGETFAVEDTRVFKELLNHLGISLLGKKIYSFHDQSEQSTLNKLVDMAQGQDLYVASEAGSPIISDPAYPLILLAYEKGIKVESYSGVSSPIMALELSGLPPIPFHFHGFLSRDSGKRQKFFAESSYGTHIFFEAPTRVEETLSELSSIKGESDICVVRELSKKFEQVERFKGKQWPQKRESINFKGEFVILFHNSDPGFQSYEELRLLAKDVLDKGTHPKQIAKILALLLDRPAKEVYSELNSHKK